MVTGEKKLLLDTYAIDYSSDPEFVAEGLALKLTEEMLECLEQKNKNQSWLADQMRVSRAHVSSILNARPNMTLLTIAKIAVALGVKPDVCLDTEPWRLAKFFQPISSVQPEPTAIIATPKIEQQIPVTA
jgi:transcriptional regulator with XRE-family HTH domain